MPDHDNGLLFLTTSLIIQIYDLEHHSRCKRHTVFALKCFRRHMLLEICSKCEILLKCCPKCVRVLKMQNSAPNSKKCSKGAQRNRERPTLAQMTSGYFPRWRNTHSFLGPLDFSRWRSSQISHLGDRCRCQNSHPRALYEV